MIAGGSGITPMYQILEQALKDKANKTKFTLIFANVTPKDILLKEEFDDLQKKHPETLKVVYTVDKPDAEWKGTYLEMPFFAFSVIRLISSCLIRCHWLC